jgi:transcriptional regulator with XRE-family HTH domain
MDLITALKTRKEKTGLSYEKIGRLANVSKNTVIAIFKNPEITNYGNVKKVCHVLGVLEGFKVAYEPEEFERPDNLNRSYECNMCGYVGQSEPCELCGCECEII